MNKNENDKPRYYNTDTLESNFNFVFQIWILDGS